MLVFITSIAGVFDAARAKLEKAVREFHTAHPLQPGIALHDLRNAEVPGAPPFVLDALLAASKEIALGGEIVPPRADRKVVLRDDEQQARAAIERAFEVGGPRRAIRRRGAGDKSGVELVRARRAPDADSAPREKLVRINADLTLHHTAVVLHPAWNRIAARRGVRLRCLHV